MQAVVKQESIQPRLKALTQQHVSAGIRWLNRMRTSEWTLTIDEARELLGGVPKRTYLSWESKAANKEPLTLSRDVTERLSLLLGIYKGLKLIAPNNRPRTAFEWFEQSNTHALFSGRSIKQYLLEMGSMESLYKVRDYLDNARG